MTQKKLKEFRSLSDAELNQLISDKKKRIMNLTFKSRVEKLENPKEKANLRKEIAVIKTILRERELQKEKEKEKK